jgi:hypothetical protein
VAAEADGIYAIDDVIKAFQKVGQAAWEADWLCRRPSVEGLVFPEFDADEHHADKPPVQLTYYRAIDWGLNVFVCLWLGVDETTETTYLLDCYRAEQGTLRQHAGYINAHAIQNVKDTFCDPAGRNRNDQTGRSNVQEFQRYGIRCSYTLSPKLTNVQNGVQLVRAMLKPASGPPKFYFIDSPGSKMFIKAMQSYRNRKVNQIWIDEPQDPQEYEHTCFPAGQMVDTPSGSRAIETLQVGDVLNSHDGLCVVEQTGANHNKELVRLRLADSRQITCTPDHPLATINGGWVRAADSMRRVLSCWKSKIVQREKVSGSSSLCGVVRSIVDTPIIRRKRREIIFAARMRAAAFASSITCIGISGNRRTVRFRKVATSIIETATSTITNWTIYSACPFPRITASTLAGMSKRCRHVWKQSAIGRFSASGAVRNIRRETRNELLDSVRPIAKQPHDGIPASMTKRESAQYAASRSLRTATHRRSIAPTNAECVSVESVERVPERATVHSLATSSGTFYINGVLVSNCDALRYYVVNRQAQHGIGVVRLGAS